MTETELLNAYIWAAKIDAKAVPLLALNKGDEFVWPRGQDGNRKTYRGRGWYSSGGRTCHRASTKTAVIPITKESGPAQQHGS